MILAQVTGSLDGTVMVWEVSSSATSIVSKHPRAVLYGHRDEITCTAINTRIGIVASTSKDGSCLIHKAHDGQYIRCLRNPKLVAQVCSKCRAALDCTTLTHRPLIAFGAGGRCRHHSRCKGATCDCTERVRAGKSDDNATRECRALLAK